MIPSLHHIAMRTADVEALAEFYRAMFGLVIVKDALPRSLWLGLAGDAVLMIELAEPGEPSPPDGTRELVAFRVDQALRDAVRSRARELGIYDGETAFTVYLRDPDGRRVGASIYEFD